MGLIQAVLWRHQNLKKQNVPRLSFEVHVSMLRKRLSGASATNIVHTLRGVGYLLSEDDSLTFQETSSR